MEYVYVQLDPTMTTIVGYMGSPQNEDEFPNQMRMPVDDPRYIAWFDAQNSIIQQGVPAPVQG